MPSLTPSYWNDRYRQSSFPWDLGEISPPLKRYIDRLEDRSLRILVPGGGNGHEVAYLWKKGFENVFLLDWAQAPIDQFCQKHPDFPADQCLVEDFFAHKGQYNLILEQTFLCALMPDQRPAYVRQMYQLIHAGGYLAGLLFTFPLTEAGPPFGGSVLDYSELFPTSDWLLQVWQEKESAPGREGKELFFEALTMK
jgi:methyl halide transferase